jgi:hypothetical protein
MRRAIPATACGLVLVVVATACAVHGRAGTTGSQASTQPASASDMDATRLERAAGSGAAVSRPSASPILAMLSPAGATGADVPPAPGSDPTPTPEPSPRPRSLVPVLATFVAPGGSEINPTPGVENRLTADAKDPVQVRYENILAVANEVRFQTVAWGPRGAVVLQRASFEPGQGHSVLFDSLGSTLPLVAARLRLTPERVRIEQTATVGEGDTALYRVVIDGLGDWSGDMREKDGWHGFSGWSRTAVLVLAGTVGPGGLGAVRLRSMEFYGDPRTAEKPRVAVLTRYAEAVGGLTGEDLARQPRAGQVSSELIQLYFNDDGTFHHGSTGGMTTFEGVPFPNGAPGVGSRPRLSGPSTAAR